MKRLVLLGNTAGMVLNYILFRIITSLDRINVGAAVRYFETFLEIKQVTVQFSDLAFLVA